MKVGIFADLHSNIEALLVMMNLYEKEKVVDYICCGDIVGYGPNPNECIEMLKEKNVYLICGNHDVACVGMKDLAWFNSDARDAILWTRSVLTSQNRLYLMDLPKMLKKYDLMIVHGSPRDPLDEYLISDQAIIENLDFFDTDVCVVGHSHYPFVFKKSKLSRYEPDLGEYEWYTEEMDGFTITIEEDCKYIINVGSVGQPRDGDNRLCCCIYNLEKKEFKFYRLNYDYTITQQKMRFYRLPPFLIERLAWGR